MEIDTAPVADAEDDPECELCDGTYVLFDGDRVCRRCGHLSGTGGDADDLDYRAEALPPAWRAYEDEREDYDGFRGSGRIKFPGGFVGAYDFGPDFGLGEGR